jgi:hypothetical protein
VTVLACKTTIIVKPTSQSKYENVKNVPYSNTRPLFQYLFQYPVPFIHVGKEVEVRGCAGKVQILADGRVIKEHLRGTLERLIYDPSCYEGDGDARVIAPPPLGSMGSRLQEIMDMAVEQRPVDLYAALAEVAR